MINVFNELVVSLKRFYELDRKDFVSIVNGNFENGIVEYTNEYGCTEIYAISDGKVISITIFDDASGICESIDSRVDETAVFEPILEELKSEIELLEA